MVHSEPIVPSDPIVPSEQRVGRLANLRAEFDGIHHFHIRADAQASSALWRRTPHMNTP
jgi:hypothetical protein